MKLRNSVISILLLSFLAASGLADVAPDPGYTRVSLSIHIEAKDDFPEYRFFVVSGDMAREVAVKKGAESVVSSLGGGARYRSGRFVAVPAASLASYGSAPAGEQLKAMTGAIVRGETPGTVELITHEFSRDVRNSEASGWTGPRYRLERTEGRGVTAVLVSGGAGDKKSDSTSGFYSTDPKTPAFWAAVAGGSLMTLAFIFFGVWALRRSRERSVGKGIQQ